MTPEQLRRLAWEKVLSARALFDAARYDDAAYVVGYAVELVLKSRNCTRNRWATFPESRAEARRRGVPKVFSHDLERLLTLADGVAIQQSSVLTIDWTRALDWSNEQRYEPAGCVSRDDSLAAITETTKLFWELVLFECVEKLVELERVLSAEWGPFCLFVLEDGICHQQGWEVLLSAWWFNDAERRVKEVADRMRASMDVDLFSAVCRVSHLHPEEEWVLRFNALPTAVSHPRYIATNNFAIDRLVPASFIITNISLPEP